MAESPPDAELFAGDGQLAALPQPARRRDQRKRLRRTAGRFHLQLRWPVLPPARALTLILPNSICFWMVYICSVRSILLAPSLQLLTSCGSSNQQSRRCSALHVACKRAPPWTSPPTLLMACSAHTAAKYSAVLSLVFWHIVCGESEDGTRALVTATFRTQWGSSCCDGGGEVRANARPAAAAAW